MSGKARRQLINLLSCKGLRYDEIRTLAVEHTISRDVFFALALDASAAKRVRNNSARFMLAGTTVIRPEMVDDFLAVLESFAGESELDFHMTAAHIMRRYSNQLTYCVELPKHWIAVNSRGIESRRGRALAIWQRLEDRQPNSNFQILRGQVNECLRRSESGTDRPTSPLRKGKTNGSQNNHAIVADLLALEDKDLVEVLRVFFAARHPNSSEAEYVKTHFFFGIAESHKLEFWETVDGREWSEWRHYAVAYGDEEITPHGSGFSEFGICIVCHTELRAMVKSVNCPICEAKSSLT